MPTQLFTITEYDEDTVSLDRVEVLRFSVFVSSFSSYFRTRSHGILHILKNVSI